MDSMGELSVTVKVRTRCAIGGMRKIFRNPANCQRQLRDIPAIVTMCVKILKPCS